MTEAVLADHAHEGAGYAQAGEAGGDIGGSAARCFLERLGTGQILARDRRHEIDQQLAESNDVGHVAYPPQDRNGPGRDTRPPRTGALQRGADQPLYSPTLSRVIRVDGMRIIGLSGFLPFMMS